MKAVEKLKIPILTYHSIDDSGSVISVAPQIFRRQMRFLWENNYHVVSLKNVIQNLNSNKPFEPKTVALTFDDGFQNFYTKAFPVLSDYNFPATVFLVTDFIGKTNDWNGNPPELPPQQLLNRSEIKELQTQEIEFGAHTKTHPDLTAISQEQAKCEIIESKAEVENLTGSESTIFAYPYGRISPEIKRLAAENFAAACSVKLGKIQASCDFFELERVDAYYLSHPKIFDAINTAAFDRYLQLRQMMRDFKSFILNN